MLWNNYIAPTALRADFYPFVAVLFILLLWYLCVIFFQVNGS